MIDIKKQVVAQQDKSTVRLSLPAIKKSQNTVISPTNKKAKVQNLLLLNTQTDSNVLPKKINTREQFVEANYELTDEALFEIY